MDKPKTLRYAEAVRRAEQAIADALPDIIDGLIAKARGGDTKAAVYLCDRVLGKTAGQHTAPADDRRKPFSDDTFQKDQDDPIQKLLGQFGAREGA
jgi:hypothetical protein